MRSNSIIVHVADDAGGKRQFVVSPRLGGPLSDLPPAFWVQLIVGLSSFLIGGWVWSLRRYDLATGLFALASFGILVFTFPAALYSTRELAIEGRAFHTLSIMNHGGALLFGAAMIALLLCYPRPLVPAGWLWAPFAVFGAWWLGDSLQLFDGPARGSHLPTMIEMIGILLAAALQYWRARTDPGARAVVRWFGLGRRRGIDAVPGLDPQPHVRSRFRHRTRQHDGPAVARPGGGARSRGQRALHRHPSRIPRQPGRSPRAHPGGLWRTSSAGLSHWPARHGDRGLLTDGFGPSLAGKGYRYAGLDGEDDLRLAPRGSASRTVLSRSALSTTVRDDAAIAAPASMGDSRMPATG